MFADPGPGGGTMVAGAVYTLPAQRNVMLPMAMQRLIPMATQGGKPRSFTLPRDCNLHTLLGPPAKEEQQARNGEFSQEHVNTCGRRKRAQIMHVVVNRTGRWTLGESGKEQKRVHALKDKENYKVFKVKGRLVTSVRVP